MRIGKATEMKRNGSSISLVSHETHVNGNVQGNGEIQIDGQVSGSIRAHTVIVTRAGYVKGEIIAACVRINGTVEGKIEGETVSLGQAARVTADIKHGSLDVEKGAFFDGECRPRITSDEQDGVLATGELEPDDKPLMLVVGEQQSPS